MIKPNLQKTGQIYPKSPLRIQKYARTFGVCITDEEVMDLKIFFNTMGRVDSENDGNPDVNSRKLFQREICRVIIYGNKDIKFSEEVEALVFPLLSTLNKRNVSRIEFGTLVRNIFAVSEEIRFASSVRDLSLLTLQEGRMTAELTILFLKIDKSSNFGRFLLKLGEVANAVDTLFDMKSDKKRGEISIKPTTSIYFSYFKYLMVEVFTLLKYAWHRPLSYLYFTQNLFEGNAVYSIK